MYFSFARGTDQGGGLYTVSWPRLYAHSSDGVGPYTYSLGCTHMAQALRVRPGPYAYGRAVAVQPGPSPGEFRGAGDPSPVHQSVGLSVQRNPFSYPRTRKRYAKL